MAAAQNAELEGTGQARTSVSRSDSAVGSACPMSFCAACTEASLRARLASMSAWDSGWEAAQPMSKTFRYILYPSWSTRRLRQTRAADERAAGARPSVAIVHGALVQLRQHVRQPPGPRAVHQVPLEADTSSLQLSWLPKLKSPPRLQHRQHHCTPADVDHGK